MSLSVPGASQSSEIDFIASEKAVKSLFALPYGEEAISVAVHNLDGTLLIDSDVEMLEPAGSLSNASSPSADPPPHHLEEDTSDTEEESGREISALPENSLSLIPISTIDSKGGALSLLKSIIQLKRSDVDDDERGVVAATASSVVRPPTVGEDKSLGLPDPEEYVDSYTSIPRIIDHRDYLSWRCRDLNLLVGSDALVYRSPAGEALTVRVEEVSHLRRLLDEHQEAVRGETFVPDHQRATLQQQGKPSYAQATAVNKHRISSSPQLAGFTAPDLDQVRLQTCIVPSSPVGSLWDSSISTGPTSYKTKTLSPVSTVVDAYLDNIMSNVPSLALCLQEKGFVQSVKLLQTDDIPGNLLKLSTLDTSRTFEMIQPNKEAEKVFSPQIMEMNATALLQFLQTNCTRNNTTYLLRREAGESQIQLYDISSISAQKQRKWIWWLSMMSYRFANRLRDLARRTTDSSLARACRSRQRSLLETTLELLEVMNDMDGNGRESLVAAIREHLADTFLQEDPTDSNDNPEQASSASPSTTFSARQPYEKVSVDALEKAQTHLTAGIKRLWPILQLGLDRQTRFQKQHARRHRSLSVGKRVRVTTEKEETSSDSDCEENTRSCSSENEAVATQLYGLHQKVVNCYLGMAEIHLKNYFSSSAMQCLRSAARRLADSIFLVGETSGPNGNDKRARAWLRRSQMQYVWLWEHCGHFARSFGGDVLWRDRGHAGADDVLSVLRDAETAFEDNKHLQCLQRTSNLYNFLASDSLNSAVDEVNLHHLSGVVSMPGAKGSIAAVINVDKDSVRRAEEYLSGQHLLKREERQVLVASCIAYQRAILAYKCLVDDTSVGQTHQDLMGLLQQRLGDACNEVGKMLLNALRSLLGSSTNAKTDPLMRAAGPLLSSALFWFDEGLASFQKCGDLRNVAMLRCNICQCYKLMANSTFAEDVARVPSHAETSLQEGVHHLLAAHDALGMRESDPFCWDMVSAELATTYLVLGVRRRQALIGSGNVPLILEALRLSPGKERSIVEPMLRAKEIYEEMGNPHQAAASHYQLALYYSKIWTCQRDESKTREKLSSAFAHYSAAHKYFSRSLRGNESTFCLLCLDLASLYASVQGEGGIFKALMCCFDTAPAFSPETIEEHASRGTAWVEQMSTLATGVEERVFKLLKSLTKLEEESGDVPKYKLLYRVGLTAKLNATTGSPESRILAWYSTLESIRMAWQKGHQGPRR